MKKIIAGLLISFTMLLSQISWGQLSEENIQNYLAHLKKIKSKFETQYAPYEWKKKHLKLNFDGVYNAIEYSLLDNFKQRPLEFSIKTLQKATKVFLRQTEDDHVAVIFSSTEKATLPLEIRSAEGKYFLAYIDREKLSPASFPYNPGDEVISMNDTPMSEVMKNLLNEIVGRNNLTDKAYAEMLLTRRYARRGLTVPQGEVTFKIKSKDTGKTSTIQIIWEYSPEEIVDPFRKNDPSSMDTIFYDKLTQLGANPQKTKGRLIERDFRVNPHFLMGLETKHDKSFHETNKIQDNPFSLGADKSFVPTLGEIVWQAPENPKIEVKQGGQTYSFSPANYNAYIYKNTEGRLIGVLRIPYYGSAFGMGYDTKSFASILKFFEEITDGLVIDQVNNPGGSTFYLYSLLRHLSPQALIVPPEKETISSEYANSLVHWIKELSAIKNDSEAQKYFGKETLSGYPISYLLTQQFLSYYRHLLKNFQQGKIFSDVLYPFGIKKINPSSEITYSKPILILINESDYSNGDFFPAIMQDNKRAKLLGVRTAGAGGYITFDYFPNLYGISLYTYTGSIAYRSHGPIEDLGVTPDIPYELKASDYQDGFSSYKKIINESINSMLK